jgi:putative transposase
MFGCILTMNGEAANWALLASGQINMRKVDGWQTLATKPIDQPIDLAA